MVQVTLAFVPLNDAAPLIVARDKGFAAAAGIELELQQFTSWTDVRIALTDGAVDGAHMLAPLAMAISLGLTTTTAQLAAPLKLNVNGNSLVIARALAEALDRDPARRLADRHATARALGDAIRASPRKPRIGVVHQYSCHMLMLRDFLAAGGVDPDRDVDLPIVPPPLTVDGMRFGDIDGFIAGEPWGSVAILEGLAELVTTTASWWDTGVEKLFAARRDRIEAKAELFDAIVRALDAAAAWCDEPANHAELARLLEQPENVGQPAEFLITALDGMLAPTHDGDPLAIPGYVAFHKGGVGKPRVEEAEWIYRQMIRWGWIEDDPARLAEARALFRPDLYQRALAEPIVR